MGFSKNRNTSGISYMTNISYKETNRSNTWCIARFGNAVNNIRYRKFAVREDFRGSLILSCQLNHIYLKEESKAAVAECISAGIKPVMITGDHKLTAVAIAKEIGIFQEGDIAMEGTEIDAATDEELSANLENISVYARVSPVHKIRIVELWQKKNKVVAMTGDGVNDAPALKKPM